MQLICITVYIAGYFNYTSFKCETFKIFTGYVGVKYVS